MTVLRRLAVLGFFLLAAMPRGHAQSVAFADGASLALYGLTFTVDCTACGSNLKLQNVPAGRGNIELQLVNTNSANPIISQALSNSFSTVSTSLSFTISVSQTSGQPATKVTSAALIETGVLNYTCNVACSASAQTAVNWSGSTFGTDPLTLALNNQAGTQSRTSPTDITSPVNPFSFVETLTLSTIGFFSAGDTLKLNSVAILFRAAPEPASLAVLAVALGGIAMVRRRRGTSAGGPAR